MMSVPLSTVMIGWCVVQKFEKIDLNLKNRRIAFWQHDISWISWSPFKKYLFRANNSHRLKKRNPVSKSPKCNTAEDFVSYTSVQMKHEQTRTNIHASQQEGVHAPGAAPLISGRMRQWSWTYTARWSESQRCAPLFSAGGLMNVSCRSTSAD